MATTISDAGNHASAADSDRVPALKSPFDATGKGYLTRAQIVAGSQPLDGDLTAIAGLSSNGIPNKTGSNTWESITLGTNWNTVLALPAAGILDNLSGVRFVATYAALTALTTDTGLADNSIYCTYGRAAEEDGGATASATSTPATSSTTTVCGSVVPLSSATTPAAQMPRTVTTSAAIRIPGAPRPRTAR